MDERTVPNLSASGVARLAYSRREAAAALGVSLDYFRDRIEPNLRCIRNGRRILIPVAELSRWVDARAIKV